MTGSGTAQKLADGATGVSWITLFLSHINQINEVLQFFALIVAIISGVCAAVYHTRKSRNT